jgi:hypothetical protein
MIIIAALIAGVLTGAVLARKRGGTKTDILHYAAVYGIAFTILGLFATLIIGRLN